MTEPTNYRAFISYSHLDERSGAWLHRRLERYRTPHALVRRDSGDGAIPRRLYPIFRDREELPTAADLGGMIEDALARSDYLIVICSPHAARSRWVDAEIRHYKKIGRAHRILALIVDGVPNAVDAGLPEDQECFPPSLKYATDADGGLTSQRAEPIAADARPVGDGRHDALLKVVAGLLHVGYDDLKRRDATRRRRRLIALTSAAGVMTVIFAMLAIAAWTARREAVHHRDLAEQHLQRAQESERQTKRQLSETFLRQGYQALDRQDWHRGMAFLSRSLRAEPRNRVARDRLLHELAHTPAAATVATFNLPDGRRPDDTHRWFDDLPRFAFSPDGSAVWAVQAFAWDEESDFDSASSPELDHVIWSGRFNIADGVWDQQHHTAEDALPPQVAIQEPDRLAIAKHNLTVTMEALDFGAYAIEVSNAQGTLAFDDGSAFGFPVYDQHRDQLDIITRGTGGFHHRQYSLPDLALTDEITTDALVEGEILSACFTANGNSVIIATVSERSPGFCVYSFSSWYPPQWYAGQPMQRIAHNCITAADRYLLVHDAAQQCYAVVAMSPGPPQAPTLTPAAAEWQPIERANACRGSDWHAELTSEDDGYGERALIIHRADGRRWTLALKSWDKGLAIATTPGDRLLLQWVALGGENPYARIIDPATGLDVLSNAAGIALPNPAIGWSRDGMALVVAGSSRMSDDGKLIEDPPQRLQLLHTHADKTPGLSKLADAILGFTITDGGDFEPALPADAATIRNLIDQLAGDADLHDWREQMRAYNRWK